VGNSSGDCNVPIHSRQSECRGSPAADELLACGVKKPRQLVAVRQAVALPWPPLAALQLNENIGEK
jgi:hypothetical protein